MGVALHEVVEGTVDDSSVASSPLPLSMHNETAPQKRYGRIPSDSQQPLLWPASGHLDLRSERESEKNAAVEMLLSVVQFLEAKGLKVGARALVDGELEFKELLSPVRAGTSIRNCRMFKRFMTFFSGSLYDVETAPDQPTVFSQQVIYAWLRQLFDSQVGKFTPRLALGCISHLTEYLDVDYPGHSQLLYRKVKDYEEGKVLAPRVNEPFDSKFIVFLEATIFDSERYTVPDRLLAARIRALIQSSTRHHDQKNTPARCIQRVVNEDRSTRGIIAQADRTKTFARSWSCSKLAVDPKYDNWTEKLYDLLVEAHSEDFSVDDHLGKRCSTDRKYFDLGPVDSQADCSHIKILMAQHNRRSPEVF